MSHGLNTKRQVRRQSERLNTLSCSGVLAISCEISTPSTAVGGKMTLKVLNARRTDAAASPHANRKGRTVKRHQLTVAPQAVPTTKPWSCGGDVGAKKMMPLALIDKE
jgi:hypothetical protein